MTLDWIRPRVCILGVALIAAIVGVTRHYRDMLEMQHNMSLQARVLTAFNDSHTGMLSVAEDGLVIAQSNQAAADIFGYSKDEMIGMKVSNVLPAAFREDHTHHIKAALELAKGGKPKVSTVRCIGVGKSGEPVDVYVRVFVTKQGVVALVSLAADMNYSTMGVSEAPTIPKPVAP